MDFMSTFSQLMQGIWGLYDYDLNFPYPLGTMDAGDILLFFATCYLVADTISLVAERRD